MSIDPLEAGRRASGSFRNAWGSESALLFSTLYISNELVVRCVSRDSAGWPTIQRSNFFAVPTGASLPSCCLFVKWASKDFSTMKFGKHDCGSIKTLF